MYTGFQCIILLPATGTSGCIKCLISCIGNKDCPVYIIGKRAQKFFKRLPELKVNMPPLLLFPADNSPLATAVIKLYDAKGSLILMRQGKFPAGKNIMSIDMSSLMAGNTI